MLYRITALGLAVFLVGCAAQKPVRAHVFLVGAHCDVQGKCTCDVIDHRLNAKTKAVEWVCR